METLEISGGWEIIKGGEECLEMLSPDRYFRTSVGNTGGPEGVCWESKEALESLGSSVT